MYAPDGKLAMTDSHDLIVLGSCGDFKAFGEGGTLDDQRVIAGGGKSLRHILKRSFSLCLILDVFPCISLLARIIFPPNACPIDWCPRQTPRRGIFPAQRSMASRLIPALSGSHGPGETTKPSNPSSLRSSMPMASLRTTSCSAPNSPKYWTML